MLIRSLPLLILSAPAVAAPNVVADLPVTGALVSAVTGEAATVLVAGNDDPHHVALRPSEARDMAAADLVVLIEGVAPAYGDAAQTLVSSVLTLEASEDHDGSDHDDGHHGDGHHDGSDHDDHGVPHAWLDPAVAVSWLDDIAAALTALEPDMAETYRANVEDAQATILQSAKNARAKLAAMPAAPMLAVHDAWDHAEQSYAITIVAAVQDSHAARPGARHLREVEALIADGAVSCLLAATGEALGSAERFDLPVVTLPLTGVADADGVAGYTGLIDALGDLGAACPQG